jgi:hypothetical protein
MDRSLDAPRRECAGPTALSIFPRSPDRRNIDQALDRQRDPFPSPSRRDCRFWDFAPGLLDDQRPQRSWETVRRVRPDRAGADDCHDLGRDRSLRRVGLHARRSPFAYLRECGGLAGRPELPRRYGAWSRLRFDQRLSDRLSPTSRLPDDACHPHHLPIHLRHRLLADIDRYHFKPFRFRPLDFHRRGNCPWRPLHACRNRRDRNRLAYCLVPDPARMAADRGRRRQAIGV